MSRAELEATARDLGIEGYRRLRRDDLARAIERADPEYFDAWKEVIGDADWDSE